MNKDGNLSDICVSSPLHFIGIGGISMSSLALYCANKGLWVTGSDMRDGEIIRRLRESGIKTYNGHSAGNVAGAGCVVYTAAIPDDNPELAYAREHGIKCFSRAEFLGIIMKDYENRICVAGMHGKSTVTSLISHTLIGAGYNPTVFSGAETEELGGACRFGSDEYFVLEACEYRDSFLSFSPDIAVVLNIDRDHTDYFKSAESVISSFEGFSLSEKVRTLIYNNDDENVAKIGKKARNGVSFGLSDGAFYRAAGTATESGHSMFDIYKGEKPLLSVRLGLVGEHNIYNALACAAVCDISGVSPEIIKRSLEDFPGLKRRFEYMGKTAAGTPVYRDYAHHPTEISAVIKSAREICDGKITCVFEPHTYSRTRDLFDTFVSSLSAADTVICTDIYAARETDTFGMSSELLCSGISAHTECFYARSYAEAAEMAVKLTRNDGIILVLGAGDVYKCADIAAERGQNA